MNGAPSSLVSSVVLAIGIAVGGLLIGRGFAGARAADRFVTVKGVSERDVKADVALWPLRVVTSGNDLAQAQAKLGTNMTHIRAFLVRHGVDTARSALQGLEVNDAYANQYRQSGQVGDRYVVRQTLIVRSGHPEVVLAASQQVGELVGQGVVLSSGDVGGGGPTFLFTQLNALKPAMIAEATARAREAATQFAAALALRPDYPQAHYNWGLALEQQGRRPEAAEHYRDALRLKPDYLKARGRLAQALLALGDDAGARREAELAERTARRPASSAQSSPPDADAQPER